MIEYLIWIIFGVLGIASYLDLKYRAVPSVFLTGAILVVLILRPENFMFGLIAFVFAIAIKDLLHDVAGMRFGIADVKILALIGLTISSLDGIFLMFLAFIILQFGYTFIWIKFVEKDGESDGEMPFIPCLFALYIVLWIGGVI